MLVFFVKRTFSFLSHIELWRCHFQIRHNLLLRQSGALSFIPVQLKQSFFFESISLPSSTLFTDSNWLDLWPCLSQKKKHARGKGVSFALFIWKTPFLLCFWSLFFIFLKFLSVHLLNESTSFAKFYSCQLSSGLTRSAHIASNLPKVNLKQPLVYFILFMVSRASTLIANFSENSCIRFGLELVITGRDVMH